MCIAQISCDCCVLLKWWNPELAYNNDFALFLVNNMTFPCNEWVIVQQFFYLLGIGYIPTVVVGGVPFPLDPPPPCSSKALCTWTGRAFF